VLFVSHNMASVKSLCQKGILLEKGSVKYIGDIRDTVEYYIGEGGSAENQYFEDLQVAPGNDVVRIKSFEILPCKPQANIDIESGVKFRLQFMCYKPDAMLDVNLLIRTLDDIVVAKVGQILGRKGEKDSKIGLYTAELVIPKYTLNAGRYKVEVIFGENQSYIVYRGFEQRFAIDNTVSDMGFNQNAQPGLLRLCNDDFNVQFVK